MFSYSEIFNIQKTTLPINAKELSGVLSKKSFMGFVQCPYTRLIDTLEDICKADTYQVSINPNAMYQNGANPFHQADCVIQVEGLRSFDEFVNKVVTTEDAKEWTDFITYSETFKDEVRVLKTQVIHKYLWNVQNINNWFETTGTALPTVRRNELISSWEEFKKSVLLSSDLYGFIDACDEGSLQQAVKSLNKNIIAKLQKYRPELDRHVENNTKRETNITIKNPIVNRIFIVSNYANQCQKDWPSIKFTRLDRHSMDAISLWQGVK